MVESGNGTPGLRGLYTTFRASTPQLLAEVERGKAKMMDVLLGNVFEALQVYLGSTYVNDFRLFGRTQPWHGLCFSL